MQPNQTERYALRLLLLNVKGACSFQDLKSFNGINYETFHEAAQKRGFLEDDKEWIKCLEEACSCDTDCGRLRELFAIILTQCQPSTPNQLWHKFKDEFSADVLYSQRLHRGDMDLPADQKTYDTTLYLIEVILNKLGKRLSDFSGMPTFSTNNVINYNTQESSLITEELNYNQEELTNFLHSTIPNLNSDQKNIFDYITKNSANGNT